MKTLQVIEFNKRNYTKGTKGTIQKNLQTAVN
jgi:hypothetical protein